MEHFRTIVTASTKGAGIAASIPVILAAAKTLNVSDADVLAIIAHAAASATPAAPALRVPTRRKLSEKKATTHEALVGKTLSVMYEGKRFQAYCAAYDAPSNTVKLVYNQGDPDHEEFEILNLDTDLKVSPALAGRTTPTLTLPSEALGVEGAFRCPQAQGAIELRRAHRSCKRPRHAWRYKARD
jgi:hypothetical protein